MKPIVAILAALLALLAVPPSTAAAAWTWPLRGELLTVYRNGDDPYAGGQHRGIDIAGDVGAHVGAAAEGTVTFAGSAGFSGLAVTVRTGDGRYDTSYLHLSAVAVREGQRVTAGERVGSVGTTGRRTVERAHLHFSVRDAGSRHDYHDPLAFLPPPPAPEPDRPRGAPAPVPGPVSRAPAPQRVGGRTPARAPSRAPAGRRAPAPARRPGRVPGDAPVPRAAPDPATDGARGAAEARVRAAVRARAPEAAQQPRARPTASSDLGRAPATAPAEQATAARPSAGAAGPGPDLGWALACLGLLLAAALVGGTGEGREAVARGRRRLVAVLRPLSGRT